MVWTGLASGLRKRGWSGVLISVAFQCFHPLYERVDFILAQPERRNSRIQCRILMAALVIVFDDFTQRRDRSIMHVRGMQADVAQSWRPKGALVGLHFCHIETPRIV